MVDRIVGSPIPDPHRSPSCTAVHRKRIHRATTCSEPTYVEARAQVEQATHCLHLPRRD